MDREGSKGNLADIIRSTLYAVLLILIMMLVFALVIKIAELSGSVIYIVNQILKVAAIFLGLLLGIKNKEKGLYKGFLSGLLFTVLAVLLFSLLSHEPVLVSGNLIEAAAGAVIGAISGAIVLMIKK